MLYKDSLKLKPNSDTFDGNNIDNVCIAQHSTGINIVLGKSDGFFGSKTLHHAHILTLSEEGNALAQWVETNVIDAERIPYFQCSEMENQHSVHVRAAHYKVQGISESGSVVTLHTKTCKRAERLREYLLEHVWHTFLDKIKCTSCTVTPI